MSIMRVKMKPLQGDAVRWDGANADELAGIAGDGYQGTHATSAIVRDRDGELVHVRPGWVVSRWDGINGVIVSSPGAWEAQAETAA